MNVIQVGPLMLNAPLLIFILSALAGYWALTYRLKRAGLAEKVGQQYFQALLLGIFIWKLSYILFDPVSVIQHPLSLLYFSGGERGVWLAIAASMVYLWYGMRKNGTSVMMNMDLLLAGWIAGSCLYHLLLLAVDRSNMGFHLLYVGLHVVLVGFLYVKNREMGNPLKVNQYVTWFSLGTFGLIFIREDRTFWIAGFTKAQVLLLLVFILSIYMDHRLRRQDNEQP